MTATPVSTLLEFLHEQLAQAEPGPAAGAAADVRQRADVAPRPTRLRRRVRRPRSTERTNRRNGYRHRDLDTRAGTMERGDPRSCGTGRYFPDWLLERRRRAEPALTTVVATCYLLGVSHPADGQAGRVPGHHRRCPSPRSR